MSEVGAYFICFNLRGSIWYTYSKPLSAERQSLIDWSHRFAPLLWFLNNYCTHISCSQLCVSPMSWWWYTCICTKDSVKNIHCHLEYIGTGLGIGKVNRWMQKKGVLPKHWRNQPRQLNAEERRFTKALEKSTAPVDFSNAKERRLPLLGMSMSQEHHRSKGRDQRKQGVVFL